MSKDLTYVEVYGNLQAEVAFFFLYVTTDHETRKEKLILS